MMKPRVISDWRSVPKWASARLMAVLTVCEGAYGFVQADPALADAVSQLITPGHFHVVMLVLGVLALLAKVVRFDGGEDKCSAG